MSNLCLGTVQFGMKYGVANTLGQPTWEESFQMLDTALDNGIDIIDTARAYGEAECILGEYFRSKRKPTDVRIISKLSPNIVNEGDKDIYGLIRRACEESLHRLSIDSLDGYLLHTPEYVHNREILEALVKLKEAKLVDNIGVSIYEISDGEAAISSAVVDYIQLTYSVFDQRGLKTSFLKKAKEAGITIFTRSAFLQGLLTMDKSNIPHTLNHAVSYIDTFERITEEFKLSKVEALLQFVKHEKDIDYLVFGVDTNQQLLQDLSIFKNCIVKKEFVETVKVAFNDMEKSVIFPSLWSNGKKIKE